MLPSSSRPTRRAVLAACGAAALAGCSDNLTTRASRPPVECGPGSYAWPMHGADPARTSSLSDRALPPADATARRFSRTGSGAGGGSVDASPVVADGTAYVAGDVRIEARDAATGERVWETDPGDGVSTSPALACGALYVSTSNKTLALDPADGTALWRGDAGAGGGVSASPVLSDDTVYIAGSVVTALDAETGTRRWQASTEHSPQGIAVGDRVYVGAASNGSGEVVALTRHGETWWRTTAPGQVYTAPAVADGTVYAVSRTGTATALDGSDGSVLWQADVEPGVSDLLAVADGRVVVGAGNGSRTVTLDAETGDRLWTADTGVGHAAPLVVGDRVLAVGANTGIHLLDAATGERLVRWSAGNVGSQPVPAAGRLFYRGWDVSEVFVVG